MIKSVSIRIAVILTAITLALIAAYPIGDGSSTGPVGNDIDSNDRLPSEADDEWDAEGGLLKIELIGYSKAVQGFIELNAESASEKIESGDGFYLYVGRPTCQWCRIIAPTLQEVSEDLAIDMYYLDSSNTDFDKSISAFREKYDIETVPAVIYFDPSEGSRPIEIDLAAEDIQGEIRSKLDIAEKSPTKVN